jgi:integrase
MFPRNRIRACSGRKGFTYLMLNLGYDLVQISIWLGHTSIEMISGKYKDRRQVDFKKRAA